MRILNPAEELPLISICVPAFNHEDFIDAALESARLQAYPNKEIIVIDDGSSDKTAECIENWVGQHHFELPVVYRTRANRGVTATLNELIEMSRGEYLVWLASDDSLLPDSLIEARVCQYANTPDGHFIVDRHPGADNVWLVGGGSGHGFKLGPALGDFVARRVLTGRDTHPFFSLQRFERS